jgi:PAS domain S-box-containing protein
MQDRLRASARLCRIVILKKLKTSYPISLQLATVLVLAAGLILLHYRTGSGSSELHNLYFHLSYFPIILAGFWFGIWGGVLSAAGFVLALLPQIYLVHGFGLIDAPTRYIEFLIYLAVGGGVGFLSSAQQREKRRYQQTAEQLAESSARLEEQYQELRRLERYVESVLNSLSSGVLSLNGEGVITFANSMAHKLLASREELRGKRLSDAVPEFAEVVRERCVPPQDVCEWQLPQNGLDSVLLEINVTPLVDHKGERSGHVVLFSDITERKRLEQDLLAAERLAAVGAMAAGIAHEIKNPLQSIRGTAQVLARETSLPKQKKGLAQMMMEEIDRLNGLVNNFLLFARPREPILIEGDLNHLIDKTIELVRNQGIPADAIQFEPAAELPPVRFDPEQMKQVLLNLIANAIEAGREAAPVCVQTRVAGNFVTIDVRDRGPGIPESERDKIFTPFYSTKASGTGLGLAISRKIVESHHGRIEFENLADGGCCFTVALPAT